MKKKCKGESDTIEVIKAHRVRWIGHVHRMLEKRITRKLLLNRAGKKKRKRNSEVAKIQEIDM